MFDKKIILLISLLLVTGSSYIIFHRKKNNNDEVNIVDNSDSSINEEESINEDAESSSSLLIVIIIIIVVIIIAAAIFFFIFYRKNKEDTGDILFKRYKKFKENEANKAKIEKVKGELNSDTILKNIVQDFEKTILDILTKKYKNPNYNNLPNNFFIVFNNNEHIADGIKILESQQSIFCHFNIKESHEFKKLFYDFFNAIVDCDLYKDENFNSKSEDEQEEIFYIFIAMIVEPFLEAAQEKTYSKNSYIFFNHNNKDTNHFKDFIIELIANLNSDTGKKATGFLNYIGNNGYFAFLFKRLVKEYYEKFYTS